MLMQQSWLHAQSQTMTLQHMHMHVMIKGHLCSKASSRVDNRGGADAHEQVTAADSFFCMPQHFTIQALAKPGNSTAPLDKLPLHTVQFVIGPMWLAYNTG